MMEHRPPRGPRGGEHPHGRGREERSLAEISVTVWLTPENAVFFMKNQLLYISHEGKEERVHLCRQFPFEHLWQYISVLNDAQTEIGIIRDLALFEGESYSVLRDELNRRYYAPEILSIQSIKERYGFSYWKVITKEGSVSFTLHDTFRSLLRAGGNRIILSDVNGNRFLIPDVEALDRKSYKKIELYL